MARVIGGVFGLEPSYSRSPSNALLTGWARGAAACHLFHNARSALAYLLRQVVPRRLWLPAHLCPDVTRAAQTCALAIRYYGVGCATDVTQGENPL